MYAQLMSIADYVAHHSIDEVPDLHTIDGGTVKTYVDEIEEGFSKQIREVCGSVEFLASQLGHSFEEQLNTPDTENLVVTYFSRTTYNLLMNEGKLPEGSVILKVLNPKVVRDITCSIQEHHFERLKVRDSQGCIPAI